MSLQHHLRTRRTLATTLVLAAGMSASMAASAGAATIVVPPPGSSIQAAVDAAAPGDTIRLKAGTYEGGVRIDKDGLTLRGAGPSKTVLVEPAGGGPCGVCVRPPPPEQLLGRLHEITVKDLSIRGFQQSLQVVLVDGLKVSRVHTSGAEFDGILVIVSSDVDIRDVHSQRSGFSGLNLGGVIGARVHKSIMRDNGGPGFEVFVSQDGRIDHSLAFGTCSGAELRTGILRGPNDESAVIGLSAWRVDHVVALANTRPCDREFAGAGVIAFGGRGLRFDHNLVLRNGFPAAPSPGGIVVLGGELEDFDSGHPGGVAVTRNVVFGNVAFDLRWDGQRPSLVSFTRNLCATSDPAGLC